MPRDGEDDATEAASESETAGPAAAAARPGTTKMPVPIIVPTPITSAASGPMSFASSSSALIGSLGVLDR